MPYVKFSEFSEIKCTQLVFTNLTHKSNTIHNTMIQFKIEK